MYTNKYLELLRFYLTDKIDDLQSSLEKGISDELYDIAGSILGSIFSVFITESTITGNGAVCVAAKVVLLVLIWLGFKFLIWGKLGRTCRNYMAIKQSDTRNLPYGKEKKLIDQYDHIACDSVLLAWDFLEKYNATSMQGTEEHQVLSPSDNIREFYLIEALYYYRKSLRVVSSVVTYSKNCISFDYTGQGIAPYRALNVCSSLEEIRDGIDAAIKNSPNISEGFRIDYKNANNELAGIIERLNKILAKHEC